MHGRALSKTRYSLTSPCGHLYNMDTSLLQTVRLVQKSQKSHIPYLYNKDTSVKWTLGSVPLVSVLKRFDCTKQEKENNMSDHSLMLCLYGKTLSQVHVEGSLAYPNYRHWANFSYIFWQNVANCLHEKQKVGSATTSCKNVETLSGKNNLSCFKSLLVAGLGDIILTSLLPPIQSYSSKFWAWSCIASNFDKGWRWGSQAQDHGQAI